MSDARGQIVHHSLALCSQAKQYCRNAAQGTGFWLLGILLLHYIHQNEYDFYRNLGFFAGR